MIYKEPDGDDPAEKTSQDELLEQTPTLGEKEAGLFLTRCEAELAGLSKSLEDSSPEVRQNAAHRIMAVLSAYYAVVHKNGLGVIDFFRLNGTYLPKVNKALGLDEAKQHSPEATAVTIGSISAALKDLAKGVLKTRQTEAQPGQAVEA